MLLRKLSLAGLVGIAAAATSLPTVAEDLPALCVENHLRAVVVSYGMVYSIPVWSAGFPVACDAGAHYVNGRKLLPSEVNALVAATMAAHRSERGSKSLSRR